MNLREFTARNRLRCESPDGFNHAISSWSLSDWITATVGELGEAANVVKKLNRIRDGVPGNKQTADELRAQLGRELADTFIYLNLIMIRAGFDPSEIVLETFEAKSLEIGYKR